jgi:hypothetical protein
VARVKPGHGQPPQISPFERQITVYDAMMAMAVVAIEKGDVTPEERRTCGIATKGPEFLFNKEIDTYCLLLLQEAVALGSEKYLTGIFRLD